MIKFSGAGAPTGTEVAAGASGSGDNLDNATMVRVYNSHGSNAYLVTVTNKDEATVLGTFTLKTKEVEYVDKNITDEMFAAHADILFTSVVVMG